MNSNLHPTQPDESEVSAYLANRLNENQAQAFEQYCLEHPQFARDVERELQLKVGFQQLNQLAKVTAIRSRPSRQTWWPIALAASAAIAAMVFFEFRPASAPALTAFRSVTDLPVILQRAPLTSIGLMQLRGPDELTRITAPGDGVIELRFLTDPVLKTLDYAIEAVPLPSGRGARLKMAGLRAEADGYLKVYLPAKQMVGKTWMVTLTLPTNAQERGGTQVYRVRIDAAGTPSS